MFKRKRKAFTLIELIAVLVIMAIIALIVTPLVMSIIRKARISADKRSIDAYGRSIELAIAGYLLDTGKFPTEVSQLTIEYSGNEVVCETTQINTDSSVYLAGCTVAGRNVENYTYGEDKTPPAPTYTAYQVGDQVSYNNINYYVIKDSNELEESVTLLKAEPLSADEVNQYGAGHVNRYTEWLQGTATNPFNDYGFVAYYSNSNCNDSSHTGCTTAYEDSDIKYVVDAWAQDQVPKGLVESRLITLDDLTNNLGMEFTQPDATRMEIESSENTPMWIFEEGYQYWTSSANTDSDYKVWTVLNNFGTLTLGTRSVSSISYYAGTANPVVRPVITLSKSVLSA